MNRIDKEIIRIIKKDDPELVSLVEDYGKANGETYKEIGSRLNKTNSAVEMTIRTECIHIYEDENMQKILDSILICQQDKKKYINCEKVSPLFPRIIAKIASLKYGFRVSKNIFISNDERIKDPRKILLEEIKEKGLPIQLFNAKEDTGEMTAFSFFYSLTKDYWLADKKERAIIGNKKVSIFYNACLFQKQRILSFFDILKLYADNDMKEYLEKNHAASMYTVNLKIARSLVGVKSSDENCNFVKAQKQSVSSFGFAIYEFKAFLEEHGNFVQGEDLSPDDNGLKLLTKKIKNAQASVEKMMG